MFIEMIIASAIGNSLTKDSPLFNYAEKAKILQLCSDTGKIKDELIKLNTAVADMYQQLQWQELIAIAMAKGAKYEGNEILSFVEIKNGISVKCSLILNARKVIEQFGSITTTRDLSNDTFEFVDVDKCLKYISDSDSKRWFKNGVLLRENARLYNIPQELKNIRDYISDFEIGNTFIYKKDKYILILSGAYRNFKLYEDSECLLETNTTYNGLYSHTTFSGFRVYGKKYFNKDFKDISKRLLFDNNKALRKQIDKEINESLLIIEDLKKTKPFKLCFVDQCHCELLPSEDA